VEPETSSEPLVFGVILLGAGRSSRMGTAKLLLPWQNTTVIGHLLFQWRELGAAQIAVVHRPEDVELLAELDRQNLPGQHRIANLQPELGMMHSVQCAARWRGWQSELTSFAIVLGDQPHIRRETLRDLLRFAAAQFGRICQPAHKGEPGHPVLLPRREFAVLRDSTAATLNVFLAAQPQKPAYCEVNDPGLLLDIDTPEDYDRCHS
jgi:molybdenum cofactor cytidylyltransferase